MAKDDAPKVLIRADSVGGGPAVLYQSDEAKAKAARAAAEEAEAEYEAKPAAMAGPAVTVVRDRSVNPDQMVEVMPLIDMPRVTIAKVTYSFARGRKAIVPLHVRELLKEKGLFGPVYR